MRTASKLSMNKFLLILIACFSLCFAPIVSAQSSDTTDSSSDAEMSDDEASEDAEEMEMEDPLLELPEPILGDINGDGMVTIDAFGDSITRGVGDGTSPGEVVEDASRPVGEAGYPLRLELSLGLPVSNLGDPGERLSREGLVRFINSIPARKPDIVIVSGGSNDAIDQINPSDFFRSVQTMINVARASGVTPVLASAPPSCCDASGFTPFIEAYDQEFRNLAVINDVPLADIGKGYSNTCRSLNTCFLLNRPEGLHPNSEGYDVSAEIIMATLLGIDLFAPDGPALLEQALDLPEGSIKTQPDDVPAAS